VKRFNRSKLSSCNKCPLRDNKRVWGEYPTDSKPRIVLVGEAPGRDEDYEGKPFVGMAGRKLNWALYEAGIQRHQVGVSNVISCRPPGNDIGSNEGLEALECCKRGFLSELASWKKDGVRVVVPLGNTALRSLGIEETISKARGSVYVQDGLVILPTYHPSFINRGMQKEEPTWIADLEKALQLSKKKYQPPKENFTIFPSLKDIESFYRRVKETKGTVAVDIETTGLRPDVSDILVVGLASDGETAVSFPFFSSGLRRYWKPDEQNKAFNLLRKILSLPTMFQNALFDVPFLENNGFEVPNIVHDVLLLHHCIHPELPHRLDYIVSIYGTTPYWKGEMKRKEGFTSDVPDETLRTYNLRDAVVLHQVLPGLLEDAKEYKVLPTYEKVSVPLIRPIMSMTMNGLPLDTAKLESWKGELRRKHGRLEKELRDIANLPSEFNLSSGDHLRYLLYGLEPVQYIRCLEELSKYEIEGSKLRKEKTYSYIDENTGEEKTVTSRTKKYQDLLNTKNAFHKTTPFQLPKGYTRRKRTATGGLAVDEETMLNIQIAANNRLSLVRKFVNPKPEHEAEEAELSRLILWLSTFRSFQEVDKLLSTYTSFPTWRDGRVHPRYLIHGTATGRLCVDPDTTFVEMPRDLRKYPKGVPMREVKEGDWVYSFDWKRELCLKRVKWIGPTKYGETVIVTYRESEKAPLQKLILSPDHLVRMWIPRCKGTGGEWEYAGNLEPGDRLMCMPPRGWKEGYATFFPHSRNRGQGAKGGGPVKEHRFVYRETHGLKKDLGKAVIHHKDGNPRNNHPDNLEWMESITAHLREHRCTPEDYEWAALVGIGKKGKQLSESTRRHYLARARKMRVQGQNHIVVSVEPGPIKELWDLEVEETHCFIGNDVALHNSSREPNAQNIPPEARKVFVASEGFLFLEADYSNLELRILSWESDDDVLQNTFAKGENAHDNNTKDLFGITPEDPLWKPARKASKIYIFGRNYGGGLKGIYKRVMQQVPELGLTFAQFVSADERYRRLHPKYTEWCTRVEGEVRSTKRLVNAFGRHRIFLGTAEEIQREGLNFGIQSAAADIINRATIRIFDLLRSKRSRLIGQIHDALLLEVAVEELEEVKAIVRKEMERPLKAWGKTVSFPVEIKIGESWGSMKEVA
jgi:uracil-DNA glycosylase family 4